MPDSERVYLATAQVFVAEPPDVPKSAALLDKAATINTALINDGVKVLFESNWVLAANTPVTLSPAAAADRFSAAVSPAEDNVIIITPKTGAKTTKNVAVEIGGVPAGKLNITVTETYPKITFALSQPLNAFYDGSKSFVTASSADGTRVTIVGVDYFNAAADDVATFNRALFGSNNIIEMTPIKAGTSNLNISVSLDGYERPFKKAAGVSDKIKYGVKVTNTKPKLKLSATSVTLARGTEKWYKTGAYNSYAEIQLLSNDTTKPNLSDFEAITGVTLTGKVNNVPFSTSLESFSNGTVRIPQQLALAPNGSHKLAVKFAGQTNAAPLELSFKINNAPSPNSETYKPTISSTVKKVTANVRYPENSVIATVPLKSSVSNVNFRNAGQTWGRWYWYYDDSEIDFLNSLTSAFSFRFVGNNLIFFVNAGRTLPKTPRTVKYDLEPGDLVVDENGQEILIPNFFKAALSINFSVTESASSFKLTQKNKIDIAKPESSTTVTVALTNTASEIDTSLSEPVKLYDQQLSGTKLDVRNTLMNRNGDFEVFDITANSFKIRADHGRVVPTVAQKLAVTIKLQNGEELVSWNQSTLKNTALTITPTQSALKGTQSLKAITLYEASPSNGVALDLGLTAPAGTALAAAAIDPASIKVFEKGKGFELVRNVGENSWSLGFEKGEYPVLLNKNKDGSDKALAGSYTLKLQLWAPNTFKYENGVPVALTNDAGAKKSKPATVSVKVTIVKEPVKTPELRLNPNDIANADGSFKNEFTGASPTPALSWNLYHAQKPGAYAILMYDTTAPGNGFVHWAVTDIPADAAGFDLSTDTAVVHNNDDGSSGYYGPNPPDSKKHTYNVVVYALKERINKTAKENFGINANPKSKNWQATKSNFEKYLVKTNIITSTQLKATYQQ
jgi:phosphatidylethanolamine-binding protein (PEBP) family uncharacterized protein